MTLISFFSIPEDADHWDDEKLDNGGSDSNYDSNSLRAPLLLWWVRIPLLKTLSLSLSLSLSYDLSVQAVILKLLPILPRQRKVYYADE